MDAQFYVYCWTNLVNGKRYVGKGRGKRGQTHGSPGALRAAKTPLSRAISKYGLSCFEYSILARGLTEPTALAFEQVWIATLGTLAPSGYNLTLGGPGVSGWAGGPRPESVKEKLRAANKGKIRPLPDARVLSGASITSAKILRALGATRGQIAEWLRVSESAVRTAIDPDWQSKNRRKPTLSRAARSHAKLDAALSLFNGTNAGDVARRAGVHALTFTRYLRELGYRPHGKHPWSFPESKRTGS